MCLSLFLRINMDHPPLTLIDLRRQSDGSVECAFVEYNMDNLTSEIVVLYFPPEQLSSLQCFISNIQTDSFIVVNGLKDEFKQFFCKPVADLSIYGCPRASEKDKTIDACVKHHDRASTRHRIECELADESIHMCAKLQEEKQECALWHLSHMFNWLSKDSNVMRMVSACIRKYHQDGPTSFNDLEWCFMPADALILLAGHHLPHIWSILPEGFKKQHPEYEYCFEHYINNAPSGADFVDGPPSAKKNCYACKGKGQKEEVNE